MGAFRGKPFIDALGRSYDPKVDVVWTVTDLQGISADLRERFANAANSPFKTKSSRRSLYVVVNDHTANKPPAEDER